jgi:site-specific DNA-cytosine methylase
MLRAALSLWPTDKGGAEIGFNRGPTLTCNHEAPILCAEISPTVTNGPPFSRTGNERVECEALVVSPPHAFKIRGGCEGGGKGYLRQDEQAFTITCGHDQQVAVPVFSLKENMSMPSVNYEISGTLQALNFEAVATQYAVRRLTPIECERLQGFPDSYTNIPWRNKPEAPDGPRYKALGNSWAVPVDFRNMRFHDGDLSGAMQAKSTGGYSLNYETGILLEAAHCHAVAYDMKQHHNPQPTETLSVTTMNCAFVRGDTPLIQTAYAVRRLTPIECERLQGFPDSYTNIPWRNKPEAPDGPRYKALGNSWAVPVVTWIGKRINEELA